MVWVKLSSEALGTTWYVIEVQWLAIDAIFYGYIEGSVLHWSYKDFLRDEAALQWSRNRSKLSLPTVSFK
jgi:hypothetical protein